MIKLPILSPLRNGCYLLQRDYDIKLQNGDLIHIDKGYQTNGADIPRIFWRLYPPYSPEYMPAVLVHDYLCDVAMQQENRDDAFLDADNAFLDVLTQLNVNKIKRIIFYNAVRAWHKLRY